MQITTDVERLGDKGVEVINRSNGYGADLFSPERGLFEEGGGHLFRRNRKGGDVCISIRMKLLQQGVRIKILIELNRLPQKTGERKLKGLSRF